jgi:hypothetical protein
MYLCMHVHICVCVCVLMCMYVCVCMYIYIYIYIYIYACAYVYMHMYILKTSMFFKFVLLQWCEITSVCVCLSVCLALSFSLSLSVLFLLNVGTCVCDIFLNVIHVHVIIRMYVRGGSRLRALNRVFEWLGWKVCSSYMSCWHESIGVCVLILCGINVEVRCEQAPLCLRYLCTHTTTHTFKECIGLNHKPDWLSSFRKWTSQANFLYQVISTMIFMRVIGRSQTLPHMCPDWQSVGLWEETGRAW